MCIRFTVMDHDLVGANDFEGECFLALRDLPVIDSSGFVQLNSIDIIDMPLTQPEEKGTTTREGTAIELVIVSLSTPIVLEIDGKLPSATNSPDALH